MIEQKMDFQTTPKEIIFKWSLTQTRKKKMTKSENGKDWISQIMSQNIHFILTWIFGMDDTPNCGQNITRSRSRSAIRSHKPQRQTHN